MTMLLKSLKKVIWIKKYFNKIEDIFYINETIPQ
jgi:hypothetical protein